MYPTSGRCRFRSVVLLPHGAASLKPRSTAHNAKHCGAGRFEDIVAAVVHDSAQRKVVFFILNRESSNSVEIGLNRRFLLAMPSIFGQVRRFNRRSVATPEGDGHVFRNRAPQARLAGFSHSSVSRKYRCGRHALLCDPTETLGSQRRLLPRNENSPICASTATLL